MDTWHRLDRRDARRRHHRSLALGGGRVRVKMVEPRLESELTPNLSKPFRAYELQVSFSNIRRRPALIR